MGSGVRRSGWVGRGSYRGRGLGIGGFGVSGCLSNSYGWRCF